MSGHRVHDLTYVARAGDTYYLATYSASVLNFDDEVSSIEPYIATIASD